MLEAESIESVFDWMAEELDGPKIEDEVEQQKTDLERVQEVFPGAKELKMVGGSNKKQLQEEPSQPLF